MIVYPMTRRESRIIRGLAGLACVLGLSVLVALAGFSWGCHSPGSQGEARASPAAAMAAPEADPQCSTIIRVPRGSCIDCGFFVVPLGQACGSAAIGADLDGNGCVDLRDFWLFQQAMGGPG
jgi:hypothetical protein